jgi:hypothetical protein
MQSENCTFQTRRSATSRVYTCTKWKTSIYGCAPAQDAKPRCTGMHLYKTENLTIRVCTCTRRKTLFTGLHLYKTENLIVRVCSFTRRMTLYGSAPAQDGKPHCTGLHVYKTENLIVRICTCTRRNTSLYGSAPIQDGKPCILC